MDFFCFKESKRMAFIYYLLFIYYYLFNVDVCYI